MRRVALAASLIAVTVACEVPADDVCRECIRLERTSVAGGALVHVATFDSDVGEAFNLENCEIAARLFESQPHVRVEYSCLPASPLTE